MKKISYYNTLASIDEKYGKIWKLTPFPVQKTNWIRHLRTGLGMSLRQLGKKLGMTPPSARELEQRESDGTITLNTLRQAAHAFDMDLYYMFVPRPEDRGKKNPLQQKTRDRAYEIAKLMAARTSTTMMLEDQSISKKKTEEQIQLLAQKIEEEMPRYLWD